MSGVAASCMEWAEPVGWGGGRFCREGCTLDETRKRMRVVAGALEEQMRNVWGGWHRARGWGGGSFGVLVVCVVGLASLLSWQIGTSLAGIRGGGEFLAVESGWLAEEGQPVAASGPANLAASIRRYYARIPGGFDAAVRAARKAGERRHLSRFPPLVYAALTANVPVVAEPFEEMEGGRKSATVLGSYSPHDGTVRVKTPQAADRLRIVREHELTHAWQFAGGPSDAEGQEKGEWATRFRTPLGDEAKQMAKLSMGCSFLRSCEGEGQFVRGYLARPIEIDPRMAAFKRWWAADHGELLDTAEKVREAIEHPASNGIPAGFDALQLLKLWDTYRDQPEVQEMLVARMLQLV